MNQLAGRARHRHETTLHPQLDDRHLRAVTPLGGGAFTLLPADA